MNTCPMEEARRNALDVTASVGLLTDRVSELRMFCD
jgi:hypothetical protein